MPDWEDEVKKKDPQSTDDNVAPVSGTFSILGSSPESPSVEKIPFAEKPSSPEKEKSGEILDTVEAPTPKARQKKTETQEKTEVQSHSSGRVVDSRDSVREIHIPLEDTQDSLTQYGDKEEGKFIEGVTSVHGSNES